MWFKSSVKKKYVKKTELYLKMYILRTTNLISFKFDMYVGIHTYVEHTICEFGKNWVINLRDAKGWNQRLSTFCK